MYKTDPGYRKGMNVAIEESTGEILKKHYDNVFVRLTEKQRDRAVILKDVDWEKAGYLANVKELEGISGADVIGEIRQGYINIESSLQALYNKQKKLSQKLRKILDKEPDVVNQRKIIDFVYSKKVEEIHEHAMRKIYLTEKN